MYLSVCVLLRFLCLQKFLQQIHFVLHFVYEFTRRGAVLFVWMLRSTYPALLCFRTVVGIVGVGFLSTLDEGRRELSLRGECAEDFAAFPEEVGGTRE